MRARLTFVLAFILAAIVVSSWFPAPAYAYGTTGKVQQYVCYFGSVQFQSSNVLGCINQVFAAAKVDGLSKSPCTTYRCQLKDEVPCQVSGNGATCSARYDMFAANGTYQGIHTIGISQTATQTVPECPPNSSEQPGGSCKCNAGHSPVGLGCSPYTCSDSMQSNEQWVITGIAQATGCGGENSGATAGCEIRFDMRSEGQDGRFYGSGGTTTGNTCEPGGSLGPGVTPASPQCPSGQCGGTFNGASMCVPCKKDVADGPSSSASSPSSGASAPAAPLGDPAAPPGAVRSTESTSCNASGQCTTTTKYFGPGGEEVGEKTKETSKDGFCVENPSSPICEKSSISGSCAAVSCTGDAITCAIAKEQAKRNCELWNPAPGGHPGVLAANGQLHPLGHPMNNVDSVSFSNVIDTSNALGGGSSCPADYSFSFGGVGLSVPFSKLCPHLAVLGNIVLAFSMLAAAFIVFR